MYISLNRIISSLGFAFALLDVIGPELSISRHPGTEASLTVASDFRGEMTYSKSNNRERALLQTQGKDGSKILIVETFLVGFALSGNATARVLRHMLEG